MLAIEKLNRFYGESHTLWDLDLDVPAGQCTCVMGRNGVGKTTLMKAIMGEVAVKSGQLRYQGNDGEIELTKKKPWKRARDWASVLCPRGGRSSRCSRWRRTCALGLPPGATG